MKNIRIKIFITLIVIIISLIYFILFISNIGINKPKYEKIEFDKNNPVENKQKIKLSNTSKSIVEKYKNLHYTVLVDDIIFCNKDLDCGYDVLSVCLRSTFLALSKTDSVGYIVNLEGIDEKNSKVCNLKMVDGSDGKKVLNCSIVYKDVDKDFLKTFFENKKYLEYCK